MHHLACSTAHLRRAPAARAEEKTQRASGRQAPNRNDRVGSAAEFPAPVQLPPCSLLPGKGLSGRQRVAENTHTAAWGEAVRQQEAPAAAAGESFLRKALSRGAPAASGAAGTESCGRQAGRARPMSRECQQAARRQPATAASPPPAPPPRIPWLAGSPEEVELLSVPGHLLPAVAALAAGVALPEHHQSELGDGSEGLACVQDAACMHHSKHMRSRGEARARQGRGQGLAGRARTWAHGAEEHVG